MPLIYFVYRLSVIGYRLSFLLLRFIVYRLMFLWFTGRVYRLSCRVGNARDCIPHSIERRANQEDAFDFLYVNYKPRIDVKPTLHRVGLRTTMNQRCIASERRSPDSLYFILLCSLFYVFVGVKNNYAIKSFHIVRYMDDLFSNT